MSTDKDIEWERNHSGWYEFKKCKRCSKMQQRKIHTFYSRISRITKWSEMNAESRRFLIRCENFNLKINKTMNLTAVEWLEEKTRQPEWHSLKRGEIIERAKEIEKQQLKEMYLKGIENYDPTFKKK